MLGVLCISSSGAPIQCYTDRAHSEGTSGPPRGLSSPASAEMQQFIPCPSWHTDMIALVRWQRETTVRAQEWKTWKWGSGTQREASLGSPGRSKIVLSDQGAGVKRCDVNAGPLGESVCGLSGWGTPEEGAGKDLWWSSRGTLFPQHCHVTAGLVVGAALCVLVHGLAISGWGQSLRWPHRASLELLEKVEAFVAHSSVTWRG